MYSSSDKLPVILPELLLNHKYKFANASLCLEKKSLVPTESLGIKFILYFSSIAFIM